MPQNIDGLKQTPSPHSAENSADEVHDDFTVAREGQTDMVIDNVRYLKTPKNSSLLSYIAHLEKADVRHLNRVESTDKHAAHFEIPRDARTLAQVAVSSENTQASRGDVFYKFGEAINNLAERAGVVPNADSVDLKTVLYSRLEDEIILVPPIDFEVYTPERVQAIEAKIANQLPPTEKDLGSYVLLAALHKGAQ